MKKHFADASTVVFVFASLAAGCAPRNLASPPAPSAPGSAAAPAPILVEPAPPAPEAAAPAAGLVTVPPATDPAVVIKDVGFKSPESVLYDPEQDVYFVSNVDGKPADVDGNGFISKVSPDGKVLELKWVDGTKKGSTLDAPKGLAVFGDTLYVADITVVRLFDRKTGAPRGKIAAIGSTFLNDVAVAPDGTVYVTDTGIKPGKDGFDPTGTDAVYKIGKAKRADKLIASKDLNGPNGVVADDKGVWVATARSDAVYRVGTDGKKDPDVKLPVGNLDGLVHLPDGSLLVSSWASSSVLRGSPGSAFEPVIRDVKSPADIGYDTKRDLVLVPLFLLDSVELAKLPGPAPVAPPSAAAPVPPPATTAAPARSEGAPLAPGKPAASFPAPTTATAPAATGTAPAAPAKK